MNKPLQMIAALAVLALLGGCQTPPDPIAELDRQNLRYDGTVTPFSTPRLLRYESSPSVKVTFDMTGYGNKGQTPTVHMKFRNRIVARGEQRVFDMAIEELRTSTGQTWQSADPPLVMAHLISTPRGSIEDVELDFSGMRGKAAIPAKDSDTYKDLVEKLKTTATHFPEQPVRTGDNMLEGRQLLEELFRQMKRQMPPPSAIRTDTLAGTVTGETVRNGRTFIVEELSGKAVILLDGTELTLGLRGYTLIDETTGFPGGGVTGITVAAHAPVLDVSVAQMVRFDASW